MKPTSRRFFLGCGVAAIASAGSLSARMPGSSPAFPDIVRPPDHLTSYRESGAPLRLQRSGERWRAQDVEIATEARQANGDRDLTVRISAPRTALTRAHLRWSETLPENLRFLGDHWERAYGDLEWRAFDGERVMPWYFLASNGQTTRALGVKTGGGAFCWWQADPAGISLWLDVRNGGTGVQLSERELVAAEVVTAESETGMSSFAVARSLCRKLCPQPRLPEKPIYGSNNWYYLYGEHMTAEVVLRDVDQLAELSTSGDNPPYMVIDGGWGKDPDGAGPWTQENSILPSMPGIAADIKSRGVRAGIWLRPLLTIDQVPEKWRLNVRRAEGPYAARLLVLDPTVPEALAYMQDGLRRVAGWGFELIKHDFSTWDLLGRAGYEMGAQVTLDGWHYADRSKTTAEIVSLFYRGIREAVGDTILIGCTTVGHLGAGIFNLQRAGDDTSGRDWNRTRKMGVNALGFRLPQHRTFYLVDPDCVPLTNDVPLDMTLRWLELVARSGTTLFISADPSAVKPEHKPMLKAALAAAARVQPDAEPLDWMGSMSPQRWRLGGQISSFDWFGEEGANPLSR